MKSCTEARVWPNTRGITTPGLIVALSIVGLTFFFSPPGMASYRDSIELNQAVTQVAGHMGIARQKAVTEHNDYVLTFTSNVEYTLLDEENSNGVQDRGEVAMGPYRLPGTVRVTHLVPAQPLVFLPSGMLRPAAQQVTVYPATANGTRKDITVWASGSIEIRA